MLQRNAISEISPNTPGFYSNAFMVRKASGGWRPVIDLKQLNHHIDAPHFRMHTITFENKVYQFRVLHFSLNTAPQVFTCLRHRVAAYRISSQRPFVTTGLYLGKSYHLHAWRLLCSTTKQQDFQGRSLSLPQLLHVGVPPQIECTMTGGYASLPGLQGEDLIRLSRVTGPV